MKFLFAIATGSHGDTDTIMLPVFELDGPSKVTLPVVPLECSLENCETGSRLRSGLGLIYFRHTVE